MSADRGDPGPAPPGVPPAVCDIAQAIPIDRKDTPGVATRLVCDPLMQPVWKWLKQHARAMHDRGELETRLAALPERYLLHHWGLSELLAVLPLEEQRPPYWKFSERYAPLPDHACAAFCACVMITLGVNNPAVTRAGIEAQASEWRLAASLCRLRLSERSFALLNPELAGHYSAVIADLEEQANFIETAARLNRSHYLERSSGARGAGDDDVRAQARAIALGAREIFGTFLYGTVATVMSVALRIDVNERKVRDWCADLPHDTTIAASPMAVDAADALGIQKLAGAKADRIKVV